MVARFTLPVRGLVLFLAMALAMAGFGHRFASAADIERAQFAQAFGAAFCQTDDKGAPVLDGSCPVCHLVASVYLPDAVGGIETPVYVQVATVSSSERHLVRAATTLTSPPQRGPPLV